MVLNYKGLPFKTQWVEYPDIEPTMKKIGAKPTMKRPNGQDLYTLPVIQDSKTGAIVSDSYEIALYLDQTYPDLPVIFPGNSQAAIAAFDYLFTEKLANYIRQFAIPLTCLKLNPPSQEYYRRKNEMEPNGKLEEWCPVGPKRDEAWTQIKAGLDLLSGFYDRNGAGKQFLFGDRFSYADAIVVGRLVWVKMHVSKEEWAALATWNDGRWNSVVDLTERFYTA